MSAIILDGNQKSALATVRSLGKQGIRFSVGATRATALSLHSRYTKEVFLYPSPYHNQSAFIERVKREARRLGGKPLVYAFSDATYLSLYAYRDELKEYVTLTLPTPQSVEIAFDKAATYSLARVSGVPTIPMYTPATKEELHEVAGKLLYPAVLKVRSSVSWKNGVGVFGTAYFAKHQEDFIEQFFALRTRYGEAPLVQELIYGDEYGVEMLTQKGVPYAKIVHRRVRSLSPTGGASVVKETITDPVLYEKLSTYAETLAEKLAWEGPIMVEFKEDRISREIYLMEINGRFWGSLPLAIAGGVDMPSLYYQAVMEGKLPDTVVEGRGGVITRHFLGDVVHLCKVFFGMSPMRNFLYPTRMETLKGFVRAFRTTKSDVWSFHDPKPALMEIADVIVKYISK